MNYTIYIVSCNFTTHVTCMLTLMTYKYSELQMSCEIQKMNCKASCKIIPFLHGVLLVYVHVNDMIYECD
jgi:hypothetical protein